MSSMDIEAMLMINLKKCSRISTKYRILIFITILENLKYCFYYISYLYID